MPKRGLLGLIDLLVYELYGLTEEEIKIVENGHAKNIYKNYLIQEL